MGHKPEMGAIQPVRLYGEGDQIVTVTPEGKLAVDAQVTAEVADSKIKGSTDAGTTWVPVRVNSSGQLEVALSGRTEPIYEAALPVQPLNAGASYTSPVIDCREFTFPGGGKGVVSISALALADRQGTLYLEGRNTISESWVRIASVAVNNTGRGLLRRTNVPYRYARLRFVNGSEAQTSFSLSYALWQVTDGQGDMWGQGADYFTFDGEVAGGTSVVICDIRSAVELYGVLITSNHGNFNITARAYKDDGSHIPLSANAANVGGEGTNSFRPVYLEGANANPFFKPLAPWHDPQNGKYAVELVLKQPLPKGFYLHVQALAGTPVNVGVKVWCRIL